MGPSILDQTEQTVVAVVKRGKILPYTVTTQAPTQIKALMIARFAYLGDANAFAVTMKERLEGHNLSVNLYLI